MATKTQEIFQCIADEHVTEDEPLKLLKKEDIISDMRTRAAISDFHPVKQIVLVSNLCKRLCVWVEIFLRAVD